MMPSPFVDARVRLRYGSRPRGAPRGTLLLLAATLAGCASSPEAPAAAAPADPAIAAAALAGTAPSAPVHAVFGWKLEEPSTRFTGRGVARVTAPYRARIDLFGPRGEAYLSAVLVEDELRLPPGAPSGLVPPAPLLWSALGVVRPPGDARLVETSVRGERTVLGYDTEQGSWRYTLESGRLVSVQHEAHGGGRHTVTLTPDATAPAPRTAVYRDWLAYRELTLELEQADHVEGFSPDIFTLGR